MHCDIACSLLREARFGGRRKVDLLASERLARSRARARFFRQTLAPSRAHSKLARVLGTLDLKLAGVLVAPEFTDRIARHKQFLACFASAQAFPLALAFVGRLEVRRQGVKTGTQRPSSPWLRPGLAGFGHNGRLLAYSRTLTS